MAVIELNSNKYIGYKTIIDDEDYEKISKYKWNIIGRIRHGKLELRPLTNLWEEEAALAYNEAALKLYGDYAVLNNIGVLQSQI